MLDAVLNTAVDAIIMIDGRGKIIHANRSVQSMFGYDSKQLVGQNIRTLMPEPDRSRHDGYIHNYNLTGRGKIIGIGRQVLGQRSDGSLIPIDLAISEVRVGDKVLYTGILRDMTERHETEEHLRQAQQKVIQSERLAAIGQMVTGLAHESRNALQRSRACLDMLELDLESAPEQRDLVHRTRAALIELQTLYAEVSNYAAPIRLGRTRERFTKLFQQVWENLQDLWEPLNVALDIQCDASFETDCDAYRLGQVFRNIFENALAVSPYGAKIFITCSLEQIENQPHIRVTFADQGNGFTDEQRAGIFTPFFTTKTKGTGLGMAISKRIVEAHGGRIYVGDAHPRPPEHVGAIIVMEIPI